MTLPGSVFSETYSQDQAYIRTRPQWLGLVALLTGLFLFPLFGNEGLTGILIVAGIMVISVVGLQITTGYSGQINLGQSAFMGVGAFICGALALHLDFPFWIAIPLGGVAAALFGSIFGIAAVRIKGFYMALTTIAAQYIFSFVMLKLPKEWFGQSAGLKLEPASFGDFSFDTDMRMYYLILVVAIIMVYGAWNLVRSKAGRALVAIRDNDNAAEIIGIDVTTYKMVAFLIGGFYAGIAGGLWAYYIRYIQVDQFTLFLSVWYVGMLIVGGMGSILGAIIGTFVIRILQEIVTHMGPQLADALPQVGGHIVFASMNMLLGAVIILFVIFEPRGLVHRWNIIKESFRIWPFPH
ncbi:branched-chain amino acid ABC transporter permease [bacterium]|nr:branched-chain amino acid ABC transporter permease [bacterium]